jgi:hypothetical protein
MTAGRGTPHAVRELERLAFERDGVLSRAELSALGVHHKYVARQVDAQRWRTVGPKVVVLHRGPLTVRARRFVAVRNAGPYAALAAWTALEAWGLQRWERTAVHPVVPRGADPPGLPDGVGSIVVHESRRHQPDHVQLHNDLPVHSVVRAAIDCGAWSPTDRAACGLLAAVVQQRLTTGDRLLAGLDTVGQVRRLRLMRAAVADIGGGAQALSEMDFARLCRRYRLPEPARQAVRRDSRGRRRYLDVEWHLPGRRPLAVEVDGVGHMEVERWYDDLLRAAEVQASDGTSVVPLPALACRVEPDRVAALLRRLLAA